MRFLVLVGFFVGGIASAQPWVPPTSTPTRYIPPTSTPIVYPTSTPTPTRTYTPTPTPTRTPTPIFTATVGPSPTPTPTLVPGAATPTPTPTLFPCVWSPNPPPLIQVEPSYLLGYQITGGYLVWPTGQRVEMYVKMPDGIRHVFYIVEKP